MFNILGFHAPSNFDENGIGNINRFNGYFDMLYNEANTRDQDDEEYLLEKRVITNINEFMGQLTAEDLKILIRAEEELSQVQMFTRIFPNKDYNQLGKYNFKLDIDSSQT